MYHLRMYIFGVSKHNSGTRYNYYMNGIVTMKIGKYSALFLTNWCFKRKQYPYSSKVYKIGQYKNNNLNIEIVPLIWPTYNDSRHYILLSWGFFWYNRIIFFVCQNWMCYCKKSIMYNLSKFVYGVISSHDVSCIDYYMNGILNTRFGKYGMMFIINLFLDHTKRLYDHYKQLIGKYNNKNLYFKIIPISPYQYNYFKYYIMLFTLMN